MQREKILNISMGHAQIAIGSGTALFQLRYKEHEHLLPETWMKNLWESTAACRAAITIPNIWIPQLQRLGDRYVMAVCQEAGFSKAEQVHLREATIVLQVHTLSDIITVDGRA